MFFQIHQIGVSHPRSFQDGSDRHLAPKSNVCKYDISNFTFFADQKILGVMACIREITA